MARRFDGLPRLWETATGAETAVELGFCFDTCHAHAAGEDLSDAVERVVAITGGIDLLHVNDCATRRAPAPTATRTSAPGRWTPTCSRR